MKQNDIPSPRIVLLGKYQKKSKEEYLLSSEEQYKIENHNRIKTFMRKKQPKVNHEYMTNNTITRYKYVGKDKNKLTSYNTTTEEKEVLKSKEIRQKKTTVKDYDDAIDNINKLFPTTKE